ncbi:hypothetical protein EPUS_05367 [Endocarpon pusillum Z07020]|uniref:Uncharacterized protein n=1 Tax=Endocarpon pusillum (strain Z07020 / HMAS-L-300199) TaxID=1263415 RepID=U1HWZ6_ENDPU|nr:uncharacterized protein EPUS_05367 [Endocarpon pusillum Z07020]ERF73944.1 hypothetical protein EPUS_05367 [Endocarpon pusillum Z07020]
MADDSLRSHSSPYPEDIEKPTPQKPWQEGLYALRRQLAPAREATIRAKEAAQHAEEAKRCALAQLRQADQAQSSRPGRRTGARPRHVGGAGPSSIIAADPPSINPRLQAPEDAAAQEQRLRPDTERRLRESGLWRSERPERSAAIIPCDSRSSADPRLQAPEDAAAREQRLRPETERRLREAGLWRSERPERSAAIIPCDSRSSADPRAPSIGLKRTTTESPQIAGLRPKRAHGLSNGASPGRQTSLQAATHDGESPGLPRGASPQGDRADRSTRKVSPPQASSETRSGQARQRSPQRSGEAAWLGFVQRGEKGRKQGEARQTSDEAGSPAPYIVRGDPYFDILEEAIQSLKRRRNQIKTQYSDTGGVREKKHGEIDERIQQLTDELKRVNKARPVETEAEFIARTGSQPEYHGYIGAVLNRTEDPAKRHQILKKDLSNLVSKWDDRVRDECLIEQYRQILMELSSRIQATELHPDSAERRVDTLPRMNTNAAAAMQSPPTPNLSAAAAAAAAGGSAPSDAAPSQQAQNGGSMSTSPWSGRGRVGRPPGRGRGRVGRPPGSGRGRGRGNLRPTSNVSVPSCTEPGAATAPLPANPLQGVAPSFVAATAPLSANPLPGVAPTSAAPSVVAARDVAIDRNLDPNNALGGSAPDTSATPI